MFSHSLHICIDEEIKLLYMIQGEDQTYVVIYIYFV